MVESTLEFSEDTVLSRIYRQVQKAPNTVALIDIEGRTLTYLSLYQQIQSIGIQLKSININRNDRVAVALPNGAEMAVAFLSIASVATCAPLNPAYRVQEFEFYLSDLDAKALVVSSGIAEAARTVAQEKNIPIIELSPKFDTEAGIFTLASEGLTQNPSLEIEPAKPEDIALVLHTSGTTSRPKIVPLTHTNLCSSANHICSALNLTEKDQCLNVMPLFHIHGLMGVLLSSISAGASVICSPGFHAPQFLNWLETHRPTWYSAVPTMHQQILSRIAANPERAEILPIRLIRSSSAPLPPQVMAGLEKAFDAPVIESYGMTEAAHQMASNPLPPQHRKPGSVGIAAGPEVQIMDEQGNFLLTGEVGEVVIRGKNVTLGYENNPEANATAFTNGWFRTGDLGYLDTENYLFLKGRIKEIINRGGEKISPREVDEVLLDHPAIEQVVTFAAPHTLLGEDVATAIVLKPGETISEQAVKEFAAQKLADFKVPRIVLFLDEIPKGPTGKRQRIGLAQKLGLTASDPTEPRATYAAPRTPVEETLVKIWSDVLDITPIGIHDNFFQLGGDSILAAQVVNRVRESLQVELSFLIFFQQPTLANMAVSIAQLQAEAVDSDEVAQLLADLESLSEDEAKNMTF